MEPQPFPPYDVEETKSITLVESLVDPKYVKTDLRKRDKYPNVDGSLEVVDDSSRTLGMFGVQVKTLQKGESKYSCPSSLVGYSEKVSLPVLIICVDSINNRAFWKHIHRWMPEYKPGQQTFTITFSETSDAIGTGYPYIQRWTGILKDYSDRIHKYPDLCIEKANKLDLSGIDPQDIALFQRFTSTINRLLDDDFPIVKEILFPGAWQLGVGVGPIDSARIGYRIYRIPWGKPAPSVCKLTGASIFEQKFDTDTVSDTLTARSSLDDPVNAGREFVLKEVAEVVERKALPVFGEMLASDIWFAFIDRYYHSLGVERCLDQYSVKDLDYALNSYLLRLVTTLMPDQLPEQHATGFLDLDSFNDLARSSKRKADPGVTPTHLILSSHRFPLNLVLSSLQYLVANQISAITRPFGRPDVVQALTEGKKSCFIWEVYSSENEIKSIKNVLVNSIQEYSRFVSGNSLRFPKSPYLDTNTALIIEYTPFRQNEGRNRPGLTEYFVDNSQQSLSKITSIIKGEATLNELYGSPNWTLEYNGKSYRILSSSHGGAESLFQTTPVLSLLYSMLSKDFKIHYDWDIRQLSPIL